MTCFIETQAQVGSGHTLDEFASRSGLFQERAATCIACCSASVATQTARGIRLNQKAASGRSLGERTISISIVATAIVVVVVATGVLLVEIESSVGRLRLQIGHEFAS